MYKQIQWGKSNPFTNTEALKITLHVQSFENIGEEEQYVLDVLSGFLHLKTLSPVLTLEDDEFPYLVVGSYSSEANSYPLTVHKSKTNRVKSWIDFPLNDSKILTCHIRENEEDTEKLRTKIRQDILFVKAHQAAKQQIFITSSPHLLENRQLNSLTDANICSPEEAMKIIGLFTRKHGDTVIHDVGKNFEDSLDVTSFYRGLAYSQLPHMVNYFNTCLAAKTYRTDILEIANSVVMRARWAIQTRDEIAQEFYGFHNSDKIAYHFTYLTLLLVGIFDAMAIIAYKAYRIDIIPKSDKTRKIPKHTVDFWFKHDGSKRPFLEELSTKAPDLYTLVSRPDFRDLTTLLRGFRNTIHRESIESFTYKNPPEPNQAYLAVPLDLDIINIIKRHDVDGLDSWGIKENDLEGIEPYTFADRLLKKMFEFINLIAEKTNLEGLFPDGTPMPSITSDKDGFWNEKTIKRIILLGW